MNSKVIDSESHKEVELSHYSKYKFLYVFIFMEILLVIFIGISFKFGDLTSGSKSVEFGETSASDIKRVYPFFQDVHVMIFVGFGFLMTFLKMNSWTAVAFNYFIACFAIQWGVVMIHFWECVLHGKWERTEIDIVWLVRGDFVAGTVLVSFGALLGRVNISQLLFVCLIEVIFATLNSVLGESVLYAVDMGGSMYIHIFGAYFGLFCALGCKIKEAQNNPKNGSDYYSNIFAMIGTVFLFMYWPSFNAALAYGNGQQRIIINTYFSLTSSVICVILISPFFKDGKLNMEIVLNATLAGGVATGANADLLSSPWIAMLVGGFSGTISSLFFKYVSAFLNKHIGLQDTCGVNNLHGFPGIIGAVVGIIASRTLSTDEFKGNVGQYFTPIMDLDRSSSSQSLHQFAVLGITLGIAMVSGYLTGLIISTDMFNQAPESFDDSQYWDDNWDNLAGDEEELLINKEQAKPLEGRVVYNFQGGKNVLYEESKQTLQNTEENRISDLKRKEQRSSTFAARPFKRTKTLAGIVGEDPATQLKKLREIAKQNSEYQIQKSPEKTVENNDHVSKNNEYDSERLNFNNEKEKSDRIIDIEIPNTNKDKSLEGENIATLGNYNYEIKDDNQQENKNTSNIFSHKNNSFTENEHENNNEKSIN